MKVNFDTQNLKIGSKKFNPFNFSIYGIDVKAENSESRIDPFNILENLVSAKKPDEGATVADDLKAMRTIINK